MLTVKKRATREAARDELAIDISAIPLLAIREGWSRLLSAASQHGAPAALSQLVLFVLQSGGRLPAGTSRRPVRVRAEPRRAPAASRPHCPWYNERPRKYEPRCGACFVDLKRNLPPADHPDEPIFRQRQPGREDVPKPRRVDRFPAVSSSSGPMLSGWAGEQVGFHCRRCPRRRVFRKDELLQRHGDRRLTDLLMLITAECPRQGNTQVYELCGAMFILPAPR